MQTGESGRSAPPGPSPAASLDDLSGRLVELRQWAGRPSYAEIARRIRQDRAARGLPPAEQRVGKVTVYDCFRPGRSRVDPDLLADIVRALGAGSQVEEWRQAHAAIEGSISAAGLARVLSELPAPGIRFVGREAELIELLAQPPGTVSSVVGMPGVGKTELALTVARWLLVEGGYDGELFVNLRGYDPDQPPVDPAAALGSMLRQLGVSGAEIQQLGAAERSARLRAITEGQRLLVVLDNAVGDDQVAPLLPAGPSRVLITSRRAIGLAGHQVSLDVLGDEDSLLLLAAAIGSERLDADPVQAQRLVELCGGLPLHLGLTAAHLARTRSWSLEDQVHRLESISRHDLVRPALAASYDALPEDAQSMLQLLALHPGDHVTPWAAAALAGQGPMWAEAALDQLVAEHLVSRDKQGSVRQHDLVRDFARGLVRAELPRSAQRQASTRLVRHYTEAVGVADQHLRGGEIDFEIWQPLPPLADVTAARDWLDLEAGNVVACALAARDDQRTDHLVELSVAITPYLAGAARFEEARTVNLAVIGLGEGPHRAKAASNLTGIHDQSGQLQEALYWAVIATSAADQRRRGAAYNSLGAVYSRLGRLVEAKTAFEVALEAAQADGNTRSEGVYLGNLATMNQYLGEIELAYRLLQTAVGVSRDAGDRQNLAYVAKALAEIELLRGNHVAAEAEARTALELEDALGLQADRPLTLRLLARIRSLRGDHGDALDLADEAVGLAHAAGQDTYEAQCLAVKGQVCAAAGRAGQARATFVMTMERAQVSGARCAEADSHIGLGELLLADQELDQARALLETGLLVARDMGDPYREARAEVGLGDCARADGEPSRAVTSWRAAYDAYLRLGSPEAGQVADRLASVSG
ncbi:ATP-binding protein [Nocardioides speluncae]|uniref:ATP-binding protein n=1 Tax=Nocardioides speluncae TaxID=2670337 RepID=UPI000D6955D3|nr:tetratricopeptide repeat protein [Nocardioides speluncae]